MSRDSVVTLIVGRGHHRNHFALCPRDRRGAKHDGRVETHRVPHDLGKLALDRDNIPDSPGPTHRRVIFPTTYAGGFVIFEDVNV